jgi:hypothetical protein
VVVDHPIDLGAGHLQTVLENAVQQEPLPVPLGERSLEVHQHRVDPVNLLVGVGVAVPHRNDQGEEFRVLLGDLGENLDEVEGPIPERILLGIRQPLEPGLELVEDDEGGLFLEHLDQDQIAWHVGLLLAESLPLALEVFPVRVALEQDVPKKLVPMEVQAFGDPRSTRCGV